MIRDHKDAILGRLRADTFLADSTFEGLVPVNPTTGKGPERYCSLFTNNGYYEVERFTGPQSTVTFSYTIHSVGSTPDQAQLVAEHVFAQMLGFTPTVAGYQCRRIRHAVSRPVQSDRDVTPAIWYCIDEFDLTSTAL